MAKPRVFISHDGWLGSAEKDDFQSLIHALMFQDRINIQGIAATGSRWGGNQKVADTHTILDTYYAQDWAKLNAHASGFKTADELKAITYQGKLWTQPTAGYSTATASSNAIIKEAKEAGAAGEKLYVLCWGGSGDVAQALHDDPSIAKHIRLFTISNQDPNANKYIANTFAGNGDLWWIRDNTTHYGTYATPDQRYTLIQGFHDTHAKGHGALGDYFYKLSLDVIGLKGVKMGDSPTILYLIDKANNADPTAESWGGEYRKIGTDYWTDRTDNTFKWSPSNGARTIYEDRAAWLKDFEQRFDWLKTTTGDDTVTITLGGSDYLGDPKAAFVFDGKEIGRATITADYEEGEAQTFTFRGTFDPDGLQTHRITVKLLNDKWDGNKLVTTDNGHDRNLLIESVTVNGITKELNKLITYGSAGWDFQL
jgi:Protein of unknown function (DUF1593)/Ca-dependent carbohydrate-binding module xylan-binding